MTLYELAFMLHVSIHTIKAMHYDELNDWLEYFRRRPFQWRDDNRAAIVALSMSGSEKVKPEDLFSSLAALKEESTPKNIAAQKFLSAFGHRVKGGDNPFDDTGKNQHS